MRLTVPQIADVPPALGQEVDRAIEADVVEEGFARVARVLNGGIGPENLAPGFAFAAADFRESKGYYELSAQYSWGGAFTEPSLFPLGTISVASTVVGLRVAVVSLTGTPPGVKAYSAAAGVGTQFGADLVSTTVDHGISTDDPIYVKYGLFTGLPFNYVYEFNLAGTWPIAADRMIYLRMSTAGSPFWFAATVGLTALHQS